MTPIEIACLVSALAFVVLVIFLARFLHTTCKTLQKAAKTLDDLDAVTRDVEGKMKCLDPLFRAASNVGEGLEFKTSAFKNVCFCKACRARLDASNACEESASAKWVHLALMGANIWQDFKTRG
jgi:uncharacterized protein YoxC